MAITKPKARRTKSADAFIAAAPDAQRKRRGRKVQITITIDPEMLNTIDRIAGQVGISRASLINMALAQVSNQGLNLQIPAAPGGGNGD